MRIGVVGGAGWLGGAIVRSLLESGLVEAGDLTLSCRRTRPDRLAGAFWTGDNQLLADRSDVIILSVRPQDWPSVTLDARGKLVISVMAGVGLAAIGARHRTGRVVRSLPNAAAEVGKAYTPWIGSGEVTDVDRDTVRRIFRACGSEDEVTSEAHMDYMSGLSGTGPAFPSLLAAAMIKGALRHGIPRDVARRAVNALLVGTGALLQHRDQDPIEVVDTFVEYRGLTAAAIETMRAGGFDTAVADGLETAFRMSASWGAENKS
jgi:pyrroline-5-carboxylate reductase